jgi:hypothetical protein
VTRWAGYKEAGRRGVAGALRPPVVKGCPKALSKHTNRSSHPDDLLAAYDRLIATVPGVERKGATMPYTSVNGNMFSFLDETGTLALRLGAADRDRFIVAFDARPHEAHGHVMKEYVAVPPGLLDSRDALGPWFAASWTYATSLKAKATARKKAP